MKRPLVVRRRVDRVLAPVVLFSTVAGANALYCHQYTNTAPNDLGFYGDTLVLNQSCWNATAAGQPETADDVCTTWTVHDPETNLTVSYGQCYRADGCSYLLGTLWQNNATMIRCDACTTDLCNVVIRYDNHMTTTTTSSSRCIYNPTIWQSPPLMLVTIMILTNFWT